MPGIMRLFVRVEGHTPFCLILADNLLVEHLEEIAIKFFRENWHNTRQAPDLILIRRIKFKNNDRLFDFKKKKRTLKASLVIEKSTTPSVYASTHQPDVLRQEFITTDPPRLVGGVVSAIGAHCETELLVKSASLDRLVMKMTDPNGSNFIRDVFLMTYRSIVKPIELLEKLIDRYDVPQLSRLGHPQRSTIDKLYYDDLTLNVKLRVFNVLEHWVDHYYFDFAEDRVYHKLHRFVREKIDGDGAPALVTAFMRLRDRTALRERKLPPLPGVLNKNLLPSTIIGTYSPAEIAHQLTLLTLHVHNAINAPELLGQQWEGPGAADVPNFIQYRDYINRVSNWVTYTIVSEQNDAARINNMAQLFKLCDELLNIHNWDMLVAVYGGLTDRSVARLSATAAAMPADAKALVPKFEELVSLKSATKVIKASMASSPRPFFPSIVIHLRDLVHLHQLPKETDGLINFLRCIQQYNLVKFLLDGQKQHLPYTPNMELIGEFSYWRIVDERILEQLSNDRQRGPI